MSKIIIASVFQDWHKIHFLLHFHVSCFSINRYNKNENMTPETSLDILVVKQISNVQVRSCSGVCAGLVYSPSGNKQLVYKQLSLPNFTNFSLL